MSISQFSNNDSARLIIAVLADQCRLILSLDQAHRFLWRHPELSRAISNKSVSKAVEEEILFTMGTDLLGKDFRWPDEKATPTETAHFFQSFVSAAERSGYRLLKYT